MLEPVFTPEQIVQLEKPIDAKRVAHRQGGGGTTLSYIEGHEAIDAANRIFGYGTWGFEIIGSPTRDHYTDGSGEIKAMWYTAKVRLHVRGCEPIEEMGLVEVQMPKPGREYTFGQQVDVAMKGAITDALKRALRCYGDQFGNSLYDKALIDGQAVKAATNQNTASTPTNRPVTQNQPVPAQRPAPAPNASQAPRPAPSTPASTPAPAPVTPIQAPAPAPAPANGDLATELQRQAILKMATNKGWDAHELRKRLFDLYGSPLDTLLKSDAGHFIKVMQGAGV